MPLDIITDLLTNKIGELTLLNALNMRSKTIKTSKKFENILENLIHAKALKQEFENFVKLSEDLSWKKSLKLGRRFLKKECQTKNKI